jgi:exosortase/archaeosortase family protein
MALTAGYAYFTQPTWPRRGILFAASVPIAILGNVARILSIVLVANYASSDFATGFYHDYSGFVVFAVAILLMVATGEAITKLFELKKGDEESNNSNNQTIQTIKQSSFSIRDFAIPSLAVALIVPLMFYQAATPDVVVAEAPRVSLGELPGFESEELGASEAELTVLPADTTIIKRRYVAPSGDWMVVSLVVGGKSKSSIHRPELCLPAQGFAMRNPRTHEVGGRDWRMIELSAKDSPSCGFAYTFFNQEGYSTASHVARIFRDVLDRSVLNRIDRWVMVSVHASRADDRGLAWLLSQIRFGDEGGAK